MKSLRNTIIFSAEVVHVGSTSSAEFEQWLARDQGFLARQSERVSNIKRGETDTSAQVNAQTDTSEQTDAKTPVILPAQEGLSQYLVFPDEPTNRILGWLIQRS